MNLTLKQQVSGSIGARWPKRKVVKWLEWGAVPAIAGLWIPDWQGGYIDLLSGSSSILAPWHALPPVITFIGAIMLFKACTEGIKFMGWHYDAVIWSSRVALVIATLSFLFHSLIFQNPIVFGALTILSIELSAFFATGVLWVTILKVAEISVEKRTRVTAVLIFILAFLALISGATTVVMIFLQNLQFSLFLRLTVILFTIAFLFCRYGVYCYKTQKSIGAGFTNPPDEQFWI